MPDWNPVPENLTVEDCLNFEVKYHPMVPVPDRELILGRIERDGVVETYRGLRRLKDRIEASVQEPYMWGFEPPHWPLADKFLDEGKDELLLLGGNRASKSEYAAKRVAQLFVGYDLTDNKPPVGEHPFPAWVKKRVRFRGLKIWCLHTTNQSSVSMQQQLVYKYIPTKLKEARKGKFTNIGFSQKNGFSDNTAVYNQNQIWFLNFAQDKKVIEGGEPDIIWCDELVPHDWLETLRYRLITRSGKLLLTFTPILGYTQVVKDYITGSRFLDFKDSPLIPNSGIMGVPKGQMPFRAIGRSGKAGIMWFHTQLNPFSPWDNMVKELQGRSSHDIKIRAYGWADNTANTMFPNFGDPCVCEPDQVPKDGTDYMAIDPAGARNWFMLWARVAKDGTIYIYREFPDITYGEWALPSEKSDGKPGPAQRIGSGRGVDEYSELIAELEGWKDREAPESKANRNKVVERFMDPRTAGNVTLTKEGGTTLVHLLEGAKYPLNFIPSADMHIDQRVLRINDRFSYNKDLPIGPNNRPKLIISKGCTNLIYSLREWTGEDGQKGASKDPVDTLGYMIVMDPQFIPDSVQPEWAACSKAVSY